MPGLYNYKLGKRDPKIHPLMPRLRDYIAAPLPTPSASVDWLSKVKDWGVMLNDTLGDCTIACAGHMMQQWTAYARNEVVAPDAAILKAYEVVSGYVPGNPATDNGAFISDALKYWQQTGLGVVKRKREGVKRWTWRHRIVAYASVNWKNKAEVQTAIQLFGSVYLGIQLPISAQNQLAWTVPTSGLTGDGTPGSWGGHAIPLGAYTPTSLTCITWGAPLDMTWEFMESYGDEAWIAVSTDWIEATGLSPSSFNLNQLEEDLKRL